VAGAVRYSLDEARSSLWRGRQAGFLATGTIAVALFVLGTFLILTTNLERLGNEWSKAAELSVFLTDTVTQTERDALEQALTPGTLIASHEYVSKPEALARFKQTFNSTATALDDLGDNPLPASIEVRLTSAAAASEQVDALVASLRGKPGVADVQYDRQWLTRVLSAIRLIRGAGLLLGGVLAVAAALTVANVVRLGLYTRRNELDIMELVGAPQTYIRGPFVAEGILQGGIGAVFALGLLALAFFAVRARYLMPLAVAVNVSSVRFLPWQVCGLLVLGGMVVGCAGGLIAASRPTNS
jgi:cell division transport system permease protein